MELSMFLAWGVFAIGLGHCLYIFRVFEFGQPAIWFFGAGLAMILLAVLNLLSIQYSQTALPGLKITARTANTEKLVAGFAFIHNCMPLQVFQEPEVGSERFPRGNYSGPIVELSP